MLYKRSSIKVSSQFIGLKKQLFYSEIATRNQRQINPLFSNTNIRKSAAFDR